MSRMYDRIMTSGFTPPARPRMDYDTAMMDRIKRAKVIAIDNVADYFYREGKHKADGWTTEDFPNVAPPFQEMFIEFNVPQSGRGPSGPLSVGMLFYAYDIANDVWIDEVAKNNVNLVEQTRKQIARHEQDSLDYHLSKYGQPTDQERLGIKKMAWYTFSYKDNTSDDVTEEAVRLYVGREFIRWYNFANLFIEYQRGRVVGPWLSWHIPVEHNGQVLRGIDGGLMLMQPVGATPGAHTEEAQRWAANITPLALHPCLLALSFMHCKNVTLENNTPPAKLSRAYERRHDKPLVRYHTLGIDPMKRVLRTEGQSEKTGLKKALHICRGHFADYSKHGLFGKVKGVFWREAHVRGSASEGAVVKDYAVKSKQQG